MQGDTRQSWHPATSPRANAGPQNPDDVTKLSKLDAEIMNLRHIQNESARLQAWSALCFRPNAISTLTQEEIWKDYKELCSASERFESQVAAGAIQLWLPLAIQDARPSLRDKTDGGWEFVFEGVKARPEYVAFKRAGFRLPAQEVVTRSTPAYANPIAGPASSSNAVAMQDSENTPNIESCLRMHYRQAPKHDVFPSTVFEAYNGLGKSMNPGSPAFSQEVLNAAVQRIFVTVEILITRGVVRLYRGLVKWNLEPGYREHAVAWLRDVFVEEGTAATPLDEVLSVFNWTFKYNGLMMDWLKAGGI